MNFNSSTALEFIEEFNISFYSPIHTVIKREAHQYDITVRPGQLVVDWFDDKMPLREGAAETKEIVVANGVSFTDQYINCQAKTD
jgi:hypothetical protein